MSSLIDNPEIICLKVSDSSLSSLRIGVAVNPYKCVKYQGDKNCRRYYDGEEAVWE